jgi:NAD(P)-dependent dehydrogenase (short-subunit alcohol dehydrogenase family)
MNNRRYALVTGSSRGIGKAIAVKLAAEGFVVAVHGSTDSPGLQESLGLVRAKSASSERFVADLGDAAAVDGMFHQIRQQFGTVDVLVNSAAIQNPSPVLELRLEDWDRVQAVNLRGAFLCAQHAGRLMRERGGGRIVNIGSVHDTVPRRHYAHYSVAKAGLSMLSRALALELADFNIQVNNLTVGGVATELTKPDRVQSLLSSLPAGRIAQPEEIADLVAYLVSPPAAYITGASITIDGGLLLGFCATRRDL